MISSARSTVLPFGRAVVHVGKAQIIHTTDIIQFFLTHTSTADNFTTDGVAWYGMLWYGIVWYGMVQRK